jgi:hypothetical protein
LCFRLTYGLRPTNRRPNDNEPGFSIHFTKTLLQVPGVIIANVISISTMFRQFQHAVPQKDAKKAWELPQEPVFPTIPVIPSTFKMKCGNKSNSSSGTAKSSEH